MGFDTYVDVAGRTLATYRKQTGDLPRFLFDLGDMTIEGGDESNPPTALRFESTASSVLSTLTQQGFGWDACVSAYGVVRGGDPTEAFLSGMFAAEGWSESESEEEASARAEARLVPLRDASPAVDLEAFGTLLAKQWLDSAKEEPFFLHAFYYGESPDASSELLSQAIDAANAEDLNPLAAARAAETFALLFGEARLVAWPMLMAVLLHHLPADTPIKYELSEGIEGFGLQSLTEVSEFVERYWHGTGTAVADYARNLGMLFGVLAEFDSRLGAHYWFGEAAAAISLIESLNADREQSTAKQRGDALERLMEALLSAEGSELTVAEKNFRTAEEEIDLVLRSNLGSPYWTAQQSPYWFVECKNWAEPAGVAALRVFESKMDDRKSTVRIGVFVSVNGYYSTFVDRLKISQTKNIGTIYAITLEDVKGLVSRRELLSDWLQGGGSMRAFGGGLSTMSD